MEGIITQVSDMHHLCQKSTNRFRNLHKKKF
jgi:hypothetical protein